MSKKKNKNRKTPAYKTQSYYDALFTPLPNKDVRKIALKVFGSLYFTLNSDK
jgi:hypothetical protein